MDRLNESQQALAEEAVARAEAIAKRYARIFPEYEQDFKSAANYGAVRAASSYSPSLNGVWERWSGLCISGEIKDFLDNSYLERRTLWPEHALDSVTREKAAPVDASLSYERLLSLLPAKHRQLCELIYGQDMSAIQAGTTLGYSTNHGAKLHREALTILRQQLAA